MDALEANDLASQPRELRPELSQYQGQEVIGPRLHIQSGNLHIRQAITAIARANEQVRMKLSRSGSECRLVALRA